MTNVWSKLIKRQWNTTTRNPPLASWLAEAPGASVFAKDETTGSHTYYGRGLDTFIGTYHFMEIVPKGRDGKGLAWHRHGSLVMMNTATSRTATEIFVSPTPHIRQIDYSTSFQKE
jgi:hypothetical protein